MFNSVKQNALSLADETTNRDWGRSIILRADTNSDGVIFYREKFLVFNPGASIVLESHTDYDEIWIPDSEMTYFLEVSDMLTNKQIAKKHERVFVPRGKKHKIINHNTHTLCIFEIQTGVIDPNDKQQYGDEDATL
jgi:mannose-1-phosphate guanylyltransferase/mannose-6-phosphate isomerase